MAIGVAVAGSQTATSAVVLSAAAEAIPILKVLVPSGVGYGGGMGEIGTMGAWATRAECDCDAAGWETRGASAVVMAVPDGPVHGIWVGQVTVPHYNRLHCDGLQPAASSHKPAS